MRRFTREALPPSYQGAEDAQREEHGFQIIVAPALAWKASMPGTP